MESCNPIRRGATVAKVNFTVARVDAHKCPAGKSQSFLWDGEAPGLGLRATASGAKSYIFQAKIHGGTVRVTIGDPRDWPINKAREEARGLQRLVDSGKDPPEHAPAHRAAHQARNGEAPPQDRTFGDPGAAYVAQRTPRQTSPPYP